MWARRAGAAVRETAPVSTRELIVLGTASQAPTRYRNHNGYLLRFDGEGFLFDPGEGTQRQMTLAGVSTHDVTHVCITHLHGDHSLGLAGVVQRMSLEQAGVAVPVLFPASQAEHVEHLRRASVFDDRTDLRPHPLREQGEVLVTAGGLRLRTARLEHGIESWGYRVQEPDGRRFVPERLERLGVRGPAVGELQANGSVVVAGRRVTLDEVSEARRGQAVAFVMDTRGCDGALALAEGVDLLVIESTFLDEHAELAEQYFHLTARQAATIAREAGARRVVLTHFSRRYPFGTDAFLAQAHDAWPDGVFVEARDLARIDLPGRG